MQFLLEAGSGDTLFLFTDGVTEAHNAQLEMMGQEQLIEALDKDPTADPKTLINNVRDAITDFVQDAPQFDDTTMLCFQFLGRRE